MWARELIKNYHLGRRSGGCFVKNTREVPRTQIHTQLHTHLAHTHTGCGPTWLAVLCNPPLTAAFDFLPHGQVVNHTADSRIAIKWLFFHFFRQGFDLWRYTEAGADFPKAKISINETFPWQGANQYSKCEKKKVYAAQYIFRNLLLLFLFFELFF